MARKRGSVRWGNPPPNLGDAGAEIRGEECIDWRRHHPGHQKGPCNSYLRGPFVHSLAAPVIGPVAPCRRAGSTTGVGAMC
jgi:hypothetical protein